MASLMFFIIKAALVLLFIYCSVAFVLVFSQKPINTAGDSLDFSRMTDSDRTESVPLSFKARDGADLHYRQYGNNAGPLIVVIHGSSAHGGLYEKLSNGIKELGTVIVPDLRGHAEQHPIGDVSYIGQLEDDIADLIQATRVSLDQKVILLGHSSGGGLVIRYCGNSEQPKPDGVVLLAPFVGFNAPTMQDEDVGGWAQPLPRRIIGLSMLSALGLKFLNNLPVISFRLPEQGDELKMVRSYSFRMNTSLAPRYDFKKDMASLPTFEILIGSEDEAFKAEEFTPLLDKIRLDNVELDGTVRVLDGLSHLDVIGDSAAHEHIAKFVSNILAVSVAN